MSEERLSIEMDRKPGLLSEPDSQQPSPELREAGRQSLIDFITTGNNIANSYQSLSPEKQKVAADFFNSYKDFLKLRFEESLRGKKFQDDAELDEFLKHLITTDLEYYPKFIDRAKGLSLSPHEIQSLLIKTLNESVKDTKNPKELCQKLGIDFQEIEETLVKIGHGTASTEQRERSTETRKKGEINKLAELLPHLIGAGFTKDQLKVSKGQIKSMQGKQMRKSPYILINISGINKQILICNFYGEGAFVSQEIFPLETIENSNKNQLETELGLTPVHHNTDGSWLKKITSLLLEGKKDLEKVKENILKRFPTSKDYLKIVGAPNKRLLITREEATILGGQSPDGTPSNQEYIKWGMRLYGETDPNLIYALKLEEEDVEYFRNVIVNGLPDGVNYFDYESPEQTKASAAKRQGCKTDIDFIKAYVPGGYSGNELGKRLQERLNLGIVIFVKIFAPEAYKTKVSEQKTKRQTEGTESFTINFLNKDFLEACKGVYPDSKQFQYLIDLEDPEKLIAMTKGDYLKREEMETLYGVDSKNGVFKLQPKEFPEFERFWDEIIIPNSKNTNQSIGAALNSTLGFGANYFCKKMGIRTESGVRINHIFKALRRVYPESGQLEYLIDIENKEKIVEMIRGTYKHNLIGLHYVSNKGGKRPLRHKPCPNFETFKQTFLPGLELSKGVRAASDEFTNNIGMGIKEFIKKMGVTLTEGPVSVVEILKATEQVYPESTDEIEKIIESKRAA